MLDDPNVSYGAPPLRVSPQPVEEAAESSDSEGGDRRPQKKPKPKKHPTFETQEHKDRSHNRWSFLLQAAYLGDDVSDEDAFRTLADSGLGIGILVSSRPKPTAARFTLCNTADVEQFMWKLVEVGRQRDATRAAPA